MTPQYTTVLFQGKLSDADWAAIHSTNKVRGESPLNLFDLVGLPSETSPPEGDNHA